MTTTKPLPAEIRRLLAAVKNLTCSEAEFQKVIVRYARDHGYLVHHPLPARVAAGQVLTAVQGDVGFPDLVIVGHGRLILAELKRQGGTVSDAQRRWIDEATAAGVEAYVWYPRHWDRIKKILYPPAA